MKPWEEKAEKYQALIKDVNALNGSVNCGRVAIRVDLLLRDGPQEGLKPVSRQNAKLFMDSIFEEGKIIASCVKDPRLLERVLKAPIVAKKRLDLSTTDDVVEIDFSPPESPEPEAHDLGLSTDGKGTKKQKVKEKKQYFYKTDAEGLSQALKNLRGRAKDGSKYGFILLTHPDTSLGHIMNFEVDAEGDVFLIDAQPKDVSKRVSKTLPEGFRPEIYYIDSNPPEGWQVKREPTLDSGDVKTREKRIEEGKERNEETAIVKFRDDVPPKIQSLLEAFLKQDEAQIDSLLKDKEIDVNFRTKSGHSIGYLIAKSRPNLDLLGLVIKKGVSLEHIFFGSIVSLDLVLTKYVRGLMQEKGQEPDLQKYANIAARLGHKTLMEYVFVLMHEKGQQPDLQQCANYAAQGGQKTLMEYVFVLMHEKGQKPDLQKCAGEAAFRGQKTFMLHLFELMHEKGQEPNLLDCKNAAKAKNHQSLVDFLQTQIEAQRRLSTPISSHSTSSLPLPSFLETPAHSSLSNSTATTIMSKDSQSSTVTAMSMDSSRSSMQNIDDLNPLLSHSTVRTTELAGIMARLNKLEEQDRTKTAEINTLKDRLQEITNRCSQFQERCHKLETRCDTLEFCSRNHCPDTNLHTSTSTLKRKSPSM